MRKAWVAVLVLSVLVLTAAFFYRPADGAILVRVRGEQVRFRKYPPSTLSEPNFTRHVGPQEAFVATAWQEGISESPGEKGDWYQLVHLSTGEKGWVAGAYVGAIDPRDEPRLQQLGRIRPQLDSPYLSLASSLLSIVAALLAILHLSLDLLHRRTRGWPALAAHSGSAVSPVQAPANPERPANVLDFEPSPAVERPAVLIGASGGVPYFHRPRTSPHGGGRKRP